MASKRKKAAVSNDTARESYSPAEAHQKIADLEAAVTRLQIANNEYLDRARAWNVLWCLVNGGGVIPHEFRIKFQTSLGRAVHAEHRECALHQKAGTVPPVWSRLSNDARVCYIRQGVAAFERAMQLAQEHVTS